MEYQMERLKAEDYDELLAVMNRAFEKQEGETFDVILPVMWERDDEHMSKHIAIRLDGKIAAVVGIYPLPAVICGRPVMFGTIGNVATLPEYSGRGLMKRLVTEALQIAGEMGFDVVRLGGKRQRYNRYGFENGGVDYQFELTVKNLLDYNGVDYHGSALSGGESYSPYITFRQIGAEDTELIQFAMELQKKAVLYADRGNTKQFYKTLSAWNKKIWIAFGKDNEPIGYVCVSEDGTDMAEHRAGSDREEYQMICDWLLFSGAQEVTFHTAPWECGLNRLMGKICEKWSLIDTSHFNPLQWSKLLDALLALKATYSLIPEGSFVLRIEGYGTVEFNGAHCVDSDKEPQLSLSHLDAVRFLLGSLPAAEVIDISEQVEGFRQDSDAMGHAGVNSAGLTRETLLYIQSVFPLPLWWCDQDRV